MTEQPEQPHQFLPLEPMPARLSTIQPGGGFIITLEKAWGVMRRCYLKIFRKGYIQKMAALRQGDHNPCPHDCFDPRDLKFYQNQKGWHWKLQDDPFAWRDKIPFARPGLAELICFSFFFGGGTILLGWAACTQLTGAASIICWVVFAIFLFCLLEVIWFFRNPHRAISQEPGLVVAPADGKVVLIEEIEHNEHIGGPAIQIGIFLSIFNVHINRSPIAAKVIGLSYKEGKHLNALRPESARENEQLTVRIEGTTAPHRKMIVRQITGAIARRIVCTIKPGDDLARGEIFGMIKLGSRTELVIPKEEGMEIVTKLGENIKAGSSVLVQYAK
ncbi:Phosphatidylserine decarboxylase [hydrothermal vent metagenome]|uniref:Phosphatidylserine decarboxylase n=1 Tax=hydrothermal vent metagenome TaxID=652676 RepID=A0A3B1E8W7_9ZZZZ